MRWINALKCKWNHRWEFVEGKWLLGSQEDRKVSLITRRCIRCGIEQDIEHYHIIPGIGGGMSHGISILSAERKPTPSDAGGE